MNVVERGRRHWHDIVRDIGLFLAGVAVAVFLLVTYINDSQTSANTARIVAAIQKAQSPAAQALGAAASRAALIRIQCDTRQSIVDVIRGLDPRLRVNLPGTAGIPAQPAIPPTKGVPNSGVPAIPAIPGCPAITLLPKP